MIKLENIQKHNDIISCNAFLEDSVTAVVLKYNTSKDEFETFSLPKGYEWCSSHITHARQYLKTLNDKADVPKERLIMWY